jgi:hypothetical protein
MEDLEGVMERPKLLSLFPRFLGDDEKTYEDFHSDYFRGTCLAFGGISAIIALLFLLFVLPQLDVAHWNRAKLYGSLWMGWGLWLMCHASTWKPFPKFTQFSLACTLSLIVPIISGLSMAFQPQYRLLFFGFFIIALFSIYTVAGLRLVFTVLSGALFGVLFYLSDYLSVVNIQSPKLNWVLLVMLYTAHTVGYLSAYLHDYRLRMEFFNATRAKSPIAHDKVALDKAS